MYLVLRARLIVNFEEFEEKAFQKQILTFVSSTARAIAPIVIKSHLKSQSPPQKVRKNSAYILLKNKQSLTHSLSISLEISSGILRVILFLLSRYSKSISQHEYFRLVSFSVIRRRTPTPCTDQRAACSWGSGGGGPWCRR